MPLNDMLLAKRDIYNLCVEIHTLKNLYYVYIYKIENHVCLAPASDREVASLPAAASFSACSTRG